MAVALRLAFPDRTLPLTASFLAACASVRTLFLFSTALTLALFLSPAVFILYWDCPFPHPTATYYVLYIGSMLLLFLQFFMAKYYSDAKKAAADKAKAAKLASESKKDM